MPFHSLLFQELLRLCAPERSVASMIQKPTILHNVYYQSAISNLQQIRLSTQISCFIYFKFNLHKSEYVAIIIARPPTERHFKLHARSHQTEGRLVGFDDDEICLAASLISKFVSLARTLFTQFVRFT